MTASSTQRVDLHVHTRHSGDFKLFILQSASVQECYTEPEKLYETLLARGMTMVTVTDHDSIAGALEIAHHGPHVFLSEEVSARFPENGCIMHVLTYGITEAQHEELQRLRYNIYELTAYLRHEKIAHSLAHPFSAVNQRLTPELLRKSFLLFDNIELINGQKDPSHERIIRDSVSRMDRTVLERWANEYDIQPATWERSWGFTGGSDDHSNLTMGRAWTEFDGDATADAFRSALYRRETRVHGLEKTGKSYAHTAYVGTIRYFEQTHRKGGEQPIMQLFNMLRSRDLPDDIEGLPPLLQRLLPAAMETLAERDSLPNGERLRLEGHTPELHDDLYEIFQTTMLRAIRGSFGSVVEGIREANPERIIDEIPTMIRLALFNAPYYFGYRFFYGERRRAAALHEGLGLEGVTDRPVRVAIFSDTVDDVNGVALGLRRIVRELRASGREVVLCAAETRPVGQRPEEEGVVRFDTTADFPLFAYEEMKLGIPSLLEVVRWLDENQIDLIQLSTPGPTGVVGMLASRILAIPIIGQYHTDVPGYAYSLIGDRTIGRIVSGYTSWFYDTVQDVVVPSHAAGELVARLGVRPERIHVIRRGVDAGRFNPGYRDPAFWKSYGLRGENVLLYIGRVSREKDMPFLAEVFRAAVDAGMPVELAVVGDGPWLEEMKTQLTGYPVAFTGYLRGEELSRAYASGDLFVFPSCTDTFGNVVVEALASGVPALVTAEGGPSEIVRHNETGWILPPGDVRRWVDAIGALVRDPQRRGRMAAAGRRFAETCTFERARADLWGFYEAQVRDFRADVRKNIR